MPRPLVAVLAVFLLLTAAAAPAQQRAAAPESLAGFDAFVEDVRQQWKLPGMAVAIVADGKIIHAAGYGVRDAEQNLPVTSRTLFAIGSITKSFTVTALGMLAEEGKLDWDKPVRDYLPEFRLHDAVATERMTPRDLVTHRSGLPRHDLLWYGADYTRAEMLERLRYLEPSKDFRSAYQYQNLMYLTAGILVERLSGQTWEEFLRRRLLAPLGMNGSNFSVHDSQRTADFAWPYNKTKEEVKRVPFRVIDAMGPAGSINSNVEEMAQYLLLHLEKGKRGETQLVPAAHVAQMQTPQMAMGAPMQYDEVFHPSYGMGFVVTAYRGHKLATHGGGIDGFVALLSFLPRKGAGIIVLTNLSGMNPAAQIVTYNALDRLLGLEPIDWNGRIREQVEKQQKAEAEAKKKSASERQEGTRPSHALAEYAGEYEHPGYGIIEVTEKGAALEARFREFTLPLEHYHYDVFQTPELPASPFSERKFRFFTALNGEVDKLGVPVEPALEEIVFTRRPAKIERAVLESLAGEYQFPGAVAVVALRADGALTMTVPGQPTYTLVPAKELTFTLQGLPGFRVEFRRDASGAVTELVSHQPNGSFVATRKK